ESFFFTPLSTAALLASSFILCIFAFDTTPCTDTVCPTCSDSFTELLCNSHVLPSLPVSRNSSALSPCDKQPVTVLISAFGFGLLSVSWAEAPNAVKAHTRAHSPKSLIFIFPPQIFRSTDERKPSRAAPHPENPHS